MEDSRYLCLIDNEIDHSCCPYPEITEPLQRASERGFTVAEKTEVQSSEERILQTVLADIRSARKDYAARSKVLLFRTLRADPTSTRMTWDELADRARDIYNRLHR